MSHSRKLLRLRRESWEPPVYNWLFRSTRGLGASLVAQRVRNLPAMQEIRVQSLDWEDPLEKGMAAHSSILAWRVAWAEESGRLWSMGVTKSQT